MSTTSDRQHPVRSGWPPQNGTPRPYDVASLARMLGVRPADSTALAVAVGIGRRWVRRYRDIGLTEAQADRWATRCGFHPGDIWAHWWSGDLMDDNPDTQPARPHATHPRTPTQEAPT